MLLASCATQSMFLFAPAVFLTQPGSVLKPTHFARAAISANPPGGGLQVSYAVTTSARQAFGEKLAGKASPRKRPRTDNGETQAVEATSLDASVLFVEKPSPIALAKAIKNQVCTHNQDVQ